MKLRFDVATLVRALEGDFQESSHIKVDKYENGQYINQDLSAQI